jgi:hypothetical protein
MMESIIVKVDELRNRLQELDEAYDVEKAHVEADEILCEFLLLLGWDDIVEAFQNVPKWYA